MRPVPASNAILWHEGQPGQTAPSFRGSTGMWHWRSAIEYTQSHPDRARRPTSHREIFCPHLRRYTSSGPAAAEVLAEVRRRLHSGGRDASMTLACASASCA